MTFIYITLELALSLLMAWLIQKHPKANEPVNVTSRHVAMILICGLLTIPFALIYNWASTAQPNPELSGFTGWVRNLFADFTNGWGYFFVYTLLCALIIFIIVKIPSSPKTEN